MDFYRKTARLIVDVAIGIASLSAGIHAGAGRLLKGLASCIVGGFVSLDRDETLVAVSRQHFACLATARLA